jgi:hypothetical protein
MESVLAIVALISIVLFIYSFFYDIDPISVFFNFTLSEQTRNKIRWTLGTIALITTGIYIGTVLFFEK